MDTKFRPSGIEGLGDMSWGTHFCLFYETKEDLLNILIPYFRTGLENHESCLWVTPQPFSPEEAKRTMREAGPEFERHLADGQIEIVSYMDWYLAEGRFDIQRVLQDWIDKHDQAIAKGYAGLRCTGNTFWLEKHQWDSFAKYEVEIDKVISKLQIIVLCTYPLEHRSARDVLDVVHQHQFTVAKRNDVWEHLEGSELKQAHDKIRQLNADLERRVVERTAQLAATNEQLKLEIIERKRAADALRRSEEKFKALFESAPVGISVLDRERKIVDLNPALEQIMRINKEGLLAGDYRSRTYIRPDGTPKPFSEFASERAINENRPIYGVETGIVLEDGQLIWVQVNAVPLDLPDASVVVITQDITERKQAEERLREYEKVVEGLEEMIVVVDREYRYIIANQAFLNYRGMQREQVLGHLISEVLDKDLFGEVIKEKLDECFQGKVVRYEMKYTYPNLGERDLFLSYFPIEGPAGIDRVACILQDITERKQAEAEGERLFEELRQSHEQLKALSGQLLKVQESERKRLAREIHDDISQTLTASIMQLGTAKSLLPKSAKSAYTILEQTEELIKNTLVQTRLIIADLRPPVLDDLGLAPALRHLGDELQESAGVTVKIKTSRLPKRLPAPIEVALFRIVQEALANIRRHAQAHHITISLAKESERVILTVQDDGIGFEKQTSQSRQRGDMVIDEGLVIPAGHFGLIGIQERVTQLGGKLKVTSAPGEGTTLRVELPL